VHGFLCIDYRLAFIDVVEPSTENAGVDRYQEKKKSTEDA